MPRILRASRANATAAKVKLMMLTFLVYDVCVCVSRLQHVSRGKATAADARDAHVFEAAVMQCHGFCVRLGHCHGR